jgi:hypothetical protein
MKKVYVVHGIHDGVLAVCSNMKRANEVVEQYNNNNDGKTHYAILSYAHITKMFNRGYYEVRSGDCRVEMFYLNHH